jgi:excisionase family DNA binding protein
MISSKGNFKMAEKKIRELWTLKEVVAYLKLPKSTVHLYIAQGKIPSFKVGRHRRFIPEEVEKAVRKMPA